MLKSKSQTKRVEEKELVMVVTIRYTYLIDIMKEFCIQNFQLYVLAVRYRIFLYICNMHTFFKMLLSKFLLCDVYIWCIGVCNCVTHRYILLSAFYSLSTNRMLHRISFKSLITLKYMRYEKVGMKSTQKQRKYMCVLIFR